MSCVSSRRRMSSSGRHLVVNSLTVREALEEVFGWKHDVSGSCEIAWTRMET